MTLDEFIKDERERLDAFEKYWQSMNKLKPDEFPLDLGESNAGLWWEMFTDFDPKAICPKCNQLWTAHDFGVPAPECP